MSIAGRTAVVTGASRGIGAALARQLAAAGVRVALVARSTEALEALAAQLGPGHLVAPCDVTSAAQVGDMVKRCTDWAAGAPDIVVNSAGVFPQAPAHEQDPEDFARAVSLNLVAPFRVVRAFLGAMRARGSGDVITIGSVADRHSYAGNAAYGAGKQGMRGLHEVIRAETRGTGVRASLISPASVDTAIWNPHEARLGRTLPARAEMLGADDVARAVVFVLAQPAHVDIDELRLSRA